MSRIISKIEISNDCIKTLKMRNKQKEFARTHRWRIFFGDRIILEAQSVKIHKSPGWFSKGYFTLNMYGAFGDNLNYILSKNHNGKDVIIGLTNMDGETKLTLKFSKVKVEDFRYTHLDLDYTKNELLMIPVTFSFKKVEITGQ